MLDSIVGLKNSGIRFGIIILFCEMFRNILNETINFFYQTPEAAEKKQEEISPGNVGITIMVTFNTGFNGKYGTVMQK